MKCCNYLILATALFVYQNAEGRSQHSSAKKEQLVSKNEYKQQILKLWNFGHEIIKTITKIEVLHIQKGLPEYESSAKLAAINEYKIFRQSFNEKNISDMTFEKRKLDDFAQKKLHRIHIKDILKLLRQIYNKNLNLIASMANAHKKSEKLAIYNEAMATGSTKFIPSNTHNMYLQTYETVSEIKKLIFDIDVAIAQQVEHKEIAQTFYAEYKNRLNQLTAHKEQLKKESLILPEYSEKDSLESIKNHLDEAVAKLIKHLKDEVSAIKDKNKTLKRKKDNKSIVSADISWLNAEKNYKKHHSKNKPYEENDSSNVLAINIEGEQDLVYNSIEEKHTTDDNSTSITGHNETSALNAYETTDTSSRIVDDINNEVKFLEQTDQKHEKRAKMNARKGKHRSKHRNSKSQTSVTNTSETILSSTSPQGMQPSSSTVDTGAQPHTYSDEQSEILPTRLDLLTQIQNGKTLNKVGINDSNASYTNSQKDSFLAQFSEICKNEDTDELITLLETQNAKNWIINSLRTAWSNEALREVSPTIYKEIGDRMTAEDINLLFSNNVLLGLITSHSGKARDLANKATVENASLKAEMARRRLDIITDDDDDDDNSNDEWDDE